MSNSSPTNPHAVSGESQAVARGRLKVFLGYAAGVGKTYQMLEEAQQLKRQSVDIVIGYFEAHARPDTIALAEGLEEVPRQVIEYRGASFEDMDTNAILQRKPRLCVVDEFAHTNIPGSERTKRWQDVMLLLESGIDVLTTMNIQHLESLNDQVYQMTGVRVRETVPDWVLHQAAEVVMTDLTPRALLNRLDRGAVYPPDKVRRAKENFFRESTLGALRELALRETAFEVEARQTSESAHVANLQQSREDDLLEPAPSPLERILVYVTPEPSSAALIRRAKRVADHFKGECLAAASYGGHTPASLPAGQREAIAKHLDFAHHLNIQTHVLSGGKMPDDLVTFARKNRVTQIYLLRPKQPAWRLLFRRDFVERLARLAQDMEVTIVAERASRPQARTWTEGSS